MIRAYGREFPNARRQLDVEFWAFREGLTVKQGGLGTHIHFRNIVSELWPNFFWHEFAEEQAEIICNNRFTGFTAGANATKSDILAKYIQVSWWSNPIETLCIVCSTSAVDADMRVWGHVVRDFRIAYPKMLIGNLVESRRLIKLSEKTDDKAASDNSSICFVAAGDEYKNDALKRLQGRKNRRVIVALDELQDCSDTISTAAYWNLCANERLEIHAAGNAASRFDAHGQFMAPVDGWNSINRTTHFWKIRVGLNEGVGAHFDVTHPDSPNMRRSREGLPQLLFMRPADEIEKARLHLGENNPSYMRQYVGFWPDAEHETNFIITDAQLAAQNAYDTPDWRSAPTEIAGIDPSYSTDGDRFIFFHVRYGQDVHGRWVIDFHEAIQVRAVTKPGETKDWAAIRVCRKLAEDRRISPRHIGMDASAGTALLSIAHQIWSPDILGVQFGGAPTDLPISEFDKRPASEVYANATSELAYVLSEFLNAGQIRGVKPDHAKELTARRYETVAGGKIKIESKADVKKRLGHSPDLADASALALRVIRERLKVKAGAAIAAGGKSDAAAWKALVQKRNPEHQKHSIQTLLKRFG